MECCPVVGSQLNQSLEFVVYIVGEIALVTFFGLAFTIRAMYSAPNAPALWRECGAEPPSGSSLPAIRALMLGTSPPVRRVRSF